MEQEKYINEVLIAWDNERIIQVVFATSEDEMNHAEYLFKYYALGYTGLPMMARQALLEEYNNRINDDPHFQYPVNRHPCLGLTLGRDYVHDGMGNESTQDSN